MTKTLTKWFAREPTSAENFAASSLDELKAKIIEYYSTFGEEAFISVVEIWSETKSELDVDEVKEISNILKSKIAEAKGENE